MFLQFRKKLLLYLPYWLPHDYHECKEILGHLQCPTLTTVDYFYVLHHFNVTECTVQSITKLIFGLKTWSLVVNCKLDKEQGVTITSQSILVVAGRK